MLAWVSRRVDAGLVLLARVGQRREVQLGVCIVLVVWAVLPGRWHHSGLAAPLAFALAVLGSAPLLTLRRFPVTSLAALLAANWAFILFGRLAWPIPVVFAWLVALLVCPIVLGARPAVAALLVTELVVLAAALFVPAHISSTPWDATVAESLAALLAWSAGVSLRERHRAAVRMRALQEADAASRGRVGIARELHDVVAHHVSLIAVRAATARYAMPDLPPPAARAFDEIAEQARTALGELRTVLGVLRVPQSAAEQAPQPRLADLDELVERVRAAGSRVEVTVTGARPVPESVQLCGYRIVQEALTNAGRYAPDSTVTVELDYGPDALVVRVRDDGCGAAGTQGPPGYGLIGMRERVTLLGGTLQAGPTGRGFAVSAVLPLAPTA